jgi:hypothetical protein
MFSWSFLATTNLHKDYVRLSVLLKPQAANASGSLNQDNVSSISLQDAFGLFQVHMGTGDAI